MRSVPRWAVWSSAGAPILLIGSWTVGRCAATRGDRPVRDTISALVTYGAIDRWLLTTGLVGLASATS